VRLVSPETVCRFEAEGIDKFSLVNNKNSKNEDEKHQNNHQILKITYERALYLKNKF
jgi:hypothetical protein